jgi:ABC-2 type transport system permease protein
MTAVETSATPMPQTAPVSNARRAFLAVLYRDVYVTWGELLVFLSQVILQPLFLLFVFGKVLGSLGYTQGNYAALLFPGLLALTAVITGMQTLAFPLVAEFGWTKEIEDRLLAPMPTSFVAAEKVLFAAARAVLATLIMIPVGILILGSIPWEWANFPLFIVITLLGALLGAALGLVMGTLVTPQRINILFSLIFTPLLFTGASQYPWPSLSRLRWFQVVTALNPMTYVSEGLRAALVPNVPHVWPWVSVVLLVVSNAGLLWVGVRGFYRRAVD